MLDEKPKKIKNLKDKPSTLSNNLRQAFKIVVIYNFI